MKRVFPLLAMLLVATFSFNVSADAVEGPAGGDTAAAAAPSLAATPETAPPQVQRIRIEVVDATESKYLKPEQIQEMANDIRTKILALSPTVQIAQTDDEKVESVLRAKIAVFTAGNRALRFWVGFGAGSARLNFTAEWLDETGGKMIESKQYERFGPGSMKSGGEIEKQMTGLVGDYCREFAAPHLK